MDSASSMQLSTGERQLWQWDTGQTILVTGDITQVHYAQLGKDTALVVEVVDGIAHIPDELLQSHGTLTAYAYISPRTITSAAWRIKERPKPEDYVYTETEVKSWETIEAEAANAIAIAQAVRDDFDTLSSTTESVRTDAEVARDEAVAAKTDVENLKDSIYYTLISPPVSAINEAIVLDCGTAAILGG